MDNEHQSSYHADARTSFWLGLSSIVLFALTGLPAMVFGARAILGLPFSTEGYRSYLKASLGIFFGIISIVTTFSFVLGPFGFGATTKRPPWENTSRDMGQIFKYLTIFAMDQDGDLPTNTLAVAPRDPAHRNSRVLEQLTWDGHITQPDLETYLRGHSRHVTGDWIYFEGHKNTDSGHLPLLISPKYKDTIVVLRVGGSVKAEPAKNLPALIKSSPATPIYIPVPP